MRTGLLLATTLLFTACEAQIEDADRAPPIPKAPAATPPEELPPPAEEPPVLPPPEPTEPPVTAPVTPPANPPPATTGSLSLGMTGTQLQLHLNETKSVKLTVTPSNGFDGTVSFAVTGLPAGVTAFFSPDQVPLTSAPVDVTMSLRSKSDLTGTLGMPLTITATSGTISSSTPLTLDLLQEVLITIPKGVNLGTAQQPNTTAFGAVSTTVIFVNPGTKVTFINMDTRNHEIHANNNATGLQHEPGQLLPNGANTYSQILKQGTVNFRCHIHPNMLGQIVVK